MSTAAHLRSFRLPLLCLLLTACGGDDSDADAPGSDASVDAGIDASALDAATMPDAGPPDAHMPDAAPDAGPTGIAAMSFEPLAPWARPIEDYLEVGRMEAGERPFLQGIHDLAVHDDRLYLGYGDANINLGRATTIEVRAFDAPEAESPEPTAEFGTDEEQIDRYRVIEGVLFNAGIDATEDAWLGNVYRLDPEDGWAKHRTVNNGVHVHDVVGLDGDLYAVGSGATQGEWQAGNIYGHLWRSTDDAETWEIVDRVHNGLEGDTRWVRLLPVADQLYMFGYRSDRMGNIRDLPNGVLTANRRRVDLLPAEHPFARVFATETDRVDDDRALLRGVDVTGDPLRNGLWLVDAEGPRLIERFADETVVDVHRHDATGEVLLLTHEEGRFTQANALMAWQMHIYVTSDFETFTELLSFDTEVRPRCVAYWGGHLFYGDDAGGIFRAVGVSP